MQTRSQAKLSNPPASQTRRTKTAETTKTNSINKVDRLSSLPPELLDLIFDYAYPLGSPSTGPLSKRLLPYHVTGLYRRIHLESTTRTAKLVDKIINDPGLGSLVKCAHLLYTDNDMDYSQDSRDFSQDFFGPEDETRFFQEVGNLQELNLGDELNELFQCVCSGITELFPTARLSTTLQHLRIAGSWCLVDFNQFSSLVSLDVIYDHDVVGDPIKIEWGDDREEDTDVTPVEDLPRLDKLKELYVDGRAYMKHARLLPSWISTMPNLEELQLELDVDGHHYDEFRLELNARLPLHLRQ